MTLTTKDVRHESAQNMCLHLAIHNIGQIKRLFNDGHEVFSHDFRHKDVRHGQQTIGSERLDQQQLMNRLTDGS